MYTEKSFQEAAAQMARRNGFSQDRAEELLSHIGDTPEPAEDGRIIVRDESDRELARVWMQ